MSATRSAVVCRWGASGPGSVTVVAPALASAAPLTAAATTPAAPSGSGTRCAGTTGGTTTVPWSCRSGTNQQATLRS